MKYIIKHISVILLIALLMPSVVQLVHTLENDHSEEHHVCVSKNDKHLHDYDVSDCSVDCNVCTFQYSSFISIASQLSFYSIVLKGVSFLTLYVSVKDTVKLSFSLRGPPVV